MEKESSRQRHFGSESFVPGDINLKELKKLLAFKREVDGLFLKALTRPQVQLSQLTELEVVDAFNAILDIPDYYQSVQTDHLDLLPEIQKLLKLTRELQSQEQKPEKKLLRTLNKALLHAIYPNVLIRSRQHHRFSSPDLLKTKVTLSPLPPLQGPSLEGKLIDISAGGMALLMHQSIPNGTFLALKAQFTDQAEVETVVQIRHSIKKGKEYLCGFQFVSIPSYISDKLDQLAKD